MFSLSPMRSRVNLGNACFLFQMRCHDFRLCISKREPINDLLVALPSLIVTWRFTLISLFICFFTTFVVFLVMFVTWIQCKGTAKSCTSEIQLIKTCLHPNLLKQDTDSMALLLVKKMYVNYWARITIVRRLKRKWRDEIAKHDWKCRGSMAGLLYPGRPWI